MSKSDSDKADPRRNYILRVASHLLGLNLIEEKLPNIKSIHKFCETTAPIFVIARHEQRGSVELSNELSEEQSTMPRVIFYKSSAIPLTTDNYKTIISVLTMRGQPAETLLASIQQVFSRSLRKTGKSKTDTQLMSLVSELEESLTTRLHSDKRATDGVISLPDEIHYWERRKELRRTDDDIATQYCDAFAPLGEKLEMVEECPLEELAEFIEVAEDCMDALWRSVEPYPETRMKQLIHIIGGMLVETIANKIDKVNIWKSENASDLLQTGISLCDQWTFAIRTLTQQSWKRNADAIWEGDTPKLDSINGFRARLDQILSLRMLSSQVGQLLNEKITENEVQEALESSMKNFDVLIYNPFTESQWRSRLQAIERSMEPIIERTIPVLKNRFQPSKIDSSLVVNDLIKYKHFLDRPRVKERLITERESLLSRLLESMSARRREFNERLSSGDVPMGRYLTEIAAKIIWIRQQITQVESTKTLSEELLCELNAYPSLKTTIDGSLEEMRSAEIEHFDSWCREITESIDEQSDPIALQTTGKLMSIEKKYGTLNVNYSDRLVKLLREVRQLGSLGFIIPSKIINCANVAEKFYKYAIVLKQVAHFYNTIEQQMLPCQQAMMLDEALTFEKLIIDGKKGDTAMATVTWDNPAKLQEFIERLQEAAQRLTVRNRKLRKAHSEICEKVIELMNLDLLKEVNKWKDIMLEIRAKFAEQERYAGSKSNMRAWIVHWDRQIYKALDLQYRWGIESLHAQIPQIQVQLVFKEQRLQLRPPIEEIRAKYYREMKKFLSIPQKFRGILDTEQANKIYAVMIERNANRFHSVYEKAEQLFDKLSGINGQFEDWIVLGQVDLEELIDEKFTRAADWEAQIKLLKGKGRETEKLPSEIKLECILVTTSAVRNAIDDMLQRLFDTLVWTLRHSINTQIQTIAQFLSQAITVLSSRPQSIDEIADANRKHTEFGRFKKEMKETMSIIDEKNRLLRSIGGSGAEQLLATMQQWEKFELMLDSHQIMIREQVGVLKSNVIKNIKMLTDEAEKLFARWNQFKPKNETLSEDRDAVLSAIEFIKEKRLQFNELQASREKLLSECEQFDMEKPDFPIIDEMEADLEEFENNWILYEQFNEQLQKLANEDWVVFRSKTYLFDEFLHQWTEKLKSLPASHMTVRIGKDVDEFKEMSDGLKYCRGEMLSNDHWLELFRLLGMPKGTTLERLHFGDLLTVHENIIANIEALKSLNARAQGEVTIREAIQELELWAAQAEFTLTEYKHTNGSVVKVIKDWKDSINSVKDTEALLQSLKNSPYYAQFTDKTSVWETRLADLDQYLQWMNEIQRKWIYLEPIFGRGSLPSEASRFSRVDAEFRTILHEVERDSRLVSLCSRQYLRRTLEQIIDQLNRCQRALNQFLEEKRSAFPRFYFLGDDDLLEILGQSTNPIVIQAHLKKLFQGINKVVFGEANQSIVAVVSAHGERVQLSKPVRIVPQVEIWLQELSSEMKSTIRSLTIDCLQQTSLDPGKYPSQVLCLAEQIRFCRDCENALDKTRDLQRFQSELKQQLATYTSSRVEDFVLDLKLKSLILDLIHHINIVDGLLKGNASNSSCWFWQKQLRFYLDTNAQHIVIRQVNAQFDYTYEYQGNAAKLVHTPLTDKCYLTLTQAMSMGLGGNPYGPAGTGKTESVKALGNLFARQVLVFNCDEGIDVHSISRIFIGLVQCGAWGCFDEFNRLDQTVLSAVSMQVQTIQNAIKSRSGVCALGNKEVSVDPNSAIFITLNPAGKGYGGRQKLPDNLKQLFRPVAMSVPDNELIAETILFSEGFKEAKLLARKLVTIFNLTREMLSQQQHYDWGLRALKTVLRGCGDMLTANPTGDERQIVVEALLLNTLSKLTFADSSRFNVLVDDVFIDVKKGKAQFDDLAEALKRVSDEMKITITDIQKRKIFELYEQMRQRMGVVLVGPSGCGKSTLWRMLKRALTIVNKPVTTYTINPKAISRTKLLGYMDLDTREWFDGVLTAAAREVVKDSSVDAWIVCDGDVDPEWVEALNSVLDDNRLLTMPSGERIQFDANVNFLFETDDLSCASPATISRMGMVFISEEDMDAREIVKAWLREEEDAHVDLQQWIDDHLYRCLKWIWDKNEYEIKVSRTATVHNALCHLRGVKSREEFLVGLYRGLSPNLSQEARDSFAQDVVFSGITLPDPRSPSNVCYDSRLGSIISYADDTTVNISLEEMQHEERRPYILTAAAQANRDTVCSWLRSDNRQPFIVFGPDGCGKESLLRYCFQTDPNSQMAILHCSAQTSAQHLLQVLAQHCVWVSSTSGRVLKPKEKANLIVYLKALNLVKPDKWGTCELVAFLQQMLTYRGYYDEKLEWVGLENIQLVVSISLADGAGKHHLATRFTSLMRICSVDYPPEQSLRSIYSAYLTPILQASVQSVSRIETLASIMVRIFEEIRSSFKETDKAHYIFTPKDLTNWSVAMMRYDFCGENAVENLNKCLLYECQRIFRDRLINSDHIQRFDEIIANIHSFSAVVQDTAVYVASPGALRGTFVTGKSLSMMPHKEYAKQLQKAIHRYESEVTIFKLPLFDELITLCAYIDRIITCPGGCALLAGKSGMGRRAAASLVANIHQMKVFTPRISSSYGMKQFENELKTVMQCAAVDAEHVLFIMEDYQILSALFLQSINSVLSSGDLPGLFTPQEFDSFSASLREQASQDAYQGDLHSYFAYKVKRNMHIILIMDIDGADFSANCNANPSLYKECTVIWKDSWSKETLFQVISIVENALI